MKRINSFEVVNVNKYNDENYNTVVDSALDKKWHIQGFNAAFNFIFHGPISAINGCHELLGYGYTEILFIFKDKYLEFHYLEEDYRNVGNEFMKRYKEDKDYLKKLISQDLELQEIGTEVMKKIDKKSLDDLSVKELLELYHEMWENYHIPIGISHLVEGTVFILEPELKKKLTEKTGLRHRDKKFTKILQTLMEPIAISFIGEEQLELLEIGKK